MDTEKRAQKRENFLKLFLKKIKKNRGALIKLSLVG